MSKKKPDNEKTVEEITRELLSGVTCGVDPITGDVNCEVSEEQWQALQSLQTHPKRVVFQVVDEEVTGG